MNSRYLTVVSLLALGLSAPALAHAADPTPTASASPTLDPAISKTALKAREQQVKGWQSQYGAGPYPDEIDGFVQIQQEPLRPYFKALYTGGERNAVLNLSRLGLAAMEVGNYTDAEHAFDAALLRIETVYSKNKSAEAARSLFHKESNKDWKGEPYERAMAYYYRGLLYLRKGDYNNAHASFKSAEYQDTVAEDEEFQRDFALMDYLIGWSSQCSGESGSGDYDVAVKAEKGLTAPGAADNVLMIAELGHGPLKVKDGRQKEKLVFLPAGGYPETGAIFDLAPVKGAPAFYAGHMASSVYYQATTRGGRAMDGILNGKANWKSGTETAAQVLVTAGIARGGDAGMYMAVLGGLFALGSSAMKTDADIRQWDSLPDGVSLSTTRMTGPFNSSISYTSETGAMTLSPMPVMQATAGKCTIVWTRSRTALTGGDTPGDDAKVRASVARKKDVILKDKLFRTGIAATFLPA